MKTTGQKTKKNRKKAQKPIKVLYHSNKQDITFFPPQFVQGKQIVCGCGGGFLNGNSSTFSSSSFHSQQILKTEIQWRDITKFTDINKKLQQQKLIDSKDNTHTTTCVLQRYTHRVLLNFAMTFESIVNSPHLKASKIHNGKTNVYS